MSHLSADPPETVVGRFNEAIERAKQELCEDANKLRTLQETLHGLCENNAEMQSNVKDAKRDRRLEALRKEQWTMEQENVQLHEQLDMNEHYMARLRAARAAVEAQQQTTRDATQAAREAYITNAVEVHAEVMAQMAPDQSLMTWGAHKLEALEAIEGLEAIVAELRARSTRLHEELHALTGTAVNEETDNVTRGVPDAPLPLPSNGACNEEAGESTCTTTAESNATATPAEVSTCEREALLARMAELTAQCGACTATQQAQQQALTVQRDALRAELTGLCEQVEALDAQEQAAQQALRSAVHDAALTTPERQTHCRSCQADIFLSFL